VALAAKAKNSLLSISDGLKKAVWTKRTNLARYATSLTCRNVVLSVSFFIKNRWKRRKLVIVAPEPIKNILVRVSKRFDSSAVALAKDGKSPSTGFQK